MSRAAHRLAALLAAGLTLTLAGALTAGVTTSARADTPTPTATPTDSPTTATAEPTTTAPSATTTSPPRQGGSGQNAQNPGPPPSSSSSTPQPTTLAINLTSITPSVVTPGSTLKIKGTVTNTGLDPIRNGTIRLLVHHSPLTNRTLVADWAAGGIADVGGRIFDAGADLSVTLQPDASGRFTITAPAARLGLLMPFASIGITLEALGDDGSPVGTHRLGLLRSFITWQSKAAYQPLRLSWLIPVTGGPSSAGGGAPDAVTLAGAVAPGSRLDNVLSAVAAAPPGPGVTLAVDPALVLDLESRSTPVRAGGDSTPTSSPTSSAASPGDSSSTSTSTAQSSPAAVASYLTALKSAADGRRIMQLPFGDPDLSGLADGKGSSLLAAADAAAGTGDASILGTAFGVPPTTDVAWPAGGWADAAAVATAHKTGSQAVVLAASSRPPADADLPATTPSALAPVTSSTDGILYDDVLSSLLMHTSSAANQVQTVQRFLAESLAIVGERPFRSRTVLVAPLRSFNPDPATARALFAAVAAAPWLKATSLQQIRNGLGEDEVAQRVASPVPASVRKQQVTAAQVTAVRKLRAEADDLTDVIPGDTVLAQARVDALRLVSSSLRTHPTIAGRRTKALRETMMDEGAKVRILPLSHLNFLTSDGNLTLSVANDLDLDVRKIRVVVQPANGRLVVVKQAPEIALDAGRRTTIKVHVHAVAGGLVPVTARIETPTGIVLGAPVTVQVHVRPTDSWAFWVLGIAAGLVFVFGLLRTLRRGRARPRLKAPEVDEL